jgi:trehalose/maltose hydrolase-like predicted phosphorylase
VRLARLPARPGSGVRCRQGGDTDRSSQPLSGRWEPDLSHYQRHVNAAIFYNVWTYFEATQDLTFLRDYGAVMMLEIARFWASIARFNPERDRYEIHGVMDPDEFHEKYRARRRAAWPAQQRLHERDGGVVL